MEKNDRFGAHLPKTVSAKLCAAPANLSPGSFDPLGGSMHFVEVQQKTGSAANRLVFTSCCMARTGATPPRPKPGERQGSGHHREIEQGQRRDSVHM